MKLSTMKFAVLASGYVNSAMMACIIERDDKKSPYYDKNFSEGGIDLADESLEYAGKICTDFVEKVEASGIDMSSWQGKVCERAGLDLFYSCAFDDMGFCKNPEIYGGQAQADKLSQIAYALGEHYLELGEDGNAHLVACESDDDADES